MPVSISALATNSLCLAIRVAVCAFTSRPYPKATRDM
jgi:hypothetical protein